MNKNNFFIAKEDSSHFDYDDFFREINQEKVSHLKYLHTDKTYDAIKNLTIGLLAQKDTVLLDSSFTEEEVTTLTGDYSNTSKSVDVSLRVSSFEDFREQLTNSAGRIGLFTSGTTGTPKLIFHKIATFLNAARVGEKYNQHIWGLAYSPTHMAGLQVIFQAMLNQNFIIELFGLGNEQIVTRLAHYNISHLSATPTFYRLMDSRGQSFNSVKRVTLGGEKSNAVTIGKIQQLFPKATINNIYATTEFGTLFISDGEHFSVKSPISKKVKFENDTLFVHKSLMGNTNNTSEWYNTGDKIEVFSENPFRFKFIGRVSSVINIGGYNVFPKEIEDSLLEVEGIKLARVFAKKNSILGNLLVAEVQKQTGSELTEKKIIEYLKKTLQPHKIPRIIMFVQNISLTGTGKVKQ